MVSLGASLERALQRLYTTGDPGFGQLLAYAQDPTDDDSVSELIELDGRLRLQRGLPVDLRRYLDAVPDLEQRPVALDTAIDVALRSLSGTSHLDDRAVQSLADQFPTLAGPIQEAAVLAQAIWSTTGLRARLSPGKSRRVVPCDFGPRLSTGRARYELRRLLGAGAGGEVYLAIDRQLSEEGHPAFIAIKLLNTSDSDPWARRRLIDEATKARRINHPNVARVLDRGVSEQDEDFIVYELVSGGDLSAWWQLQAGALDLRMAAGLVARIARGVQAAHSAGLVHCDLKPSNVLLSAEQEPKVTDFGIAVRADQHQSQAAEYPSDRPMGNLAFVSPEQYRMEDGCLSVPSDIYALGGMLFYLMTGVLPNGATIEQVQRNHDLRTGRREPPSPRRHNPRIDPTLELICRRAMALKPEDRYFSAGGLADDLEAWRRREPILWTRPTAWHRFRLWTTRRPGLAAALLLAVISIGAGTAAAAYWSAIATQQKEKAQFEKGRTDAALASTTTFLNLLRSLKGARFEQDMLPSLLALEWLSGEFVVHHPTLWSERERVVRQLVDEQVRIGRGDEFQTLLWRTTLGLWLLNDGKFDEAEPMLDAVLTVWRSRLAPGDRWLIQVEALRDSATVQRLAARAPSAGLSHDERRTLPGLQTRLTAAAELFRGRSNGTPVHRALLNALVDLTGPRLLNQAAEHKRFADEIEKLGKM